MCTLTVALTGARVLRCRSAGCVALTVCTLTVALTCARVLRCRSTRYVALTVCTVTVALTGARVQEHKICSHCVYCDCCIDRCSGARAQDVLLSLCVL